VTDGAARNLLTNRYVVEIRDAAGELLLLGRLDSKRARLGHISGSAVRVGMRPPPRLNAKETRFAVVSFEGQR
jgi:hypothetical protein